MLGSLLKISTVLTNGLGNCDFEAGMSAFKRASYSEAISHFTPCSAQVDGDQAAAFFLAISHRHLAQYDLAIATFESIIKIEPGYINAFNELAYTHEKLKNFEQALQTYRAAQAIDHQNLGASLGVARMLNWTGSHQAAVGEYRKLMKFHPDNSAVLSGLAYALMADYKLPEARELLEQILEREPANQEAAEGLNQIAQIKQNRLSVSYQENQLNDNLSRSLQLNYQRQLNARSGVGLQLKYQDNPGVRFDESGLQLYRQRKHAVKAHYAYRRDPFSFMGALGLKSADESESLFNGHIETGFKINTQTSIHVGMVAEFEQSTWVNTLSYAGLEYVKAENYALLFQGYYVSDEQFNDSQAFSLKYKKLVSPSKNWQLGLGQSLSNSQSFKTVSGQYNWSIKNGLWMQVNALHNLDNDELVLGISADYAF